MAREPNDPMVVMLAALGRQEARDQLDALRRLAAYAERFREEWASFTKHNNVDDPNLLVKWLSHERKYRVEADNLEHFMQRMTESIQEYRDCDKRQAGLNRVRLSLMEDVDFRDGGRWETLIAACEETANNSNKRRN